MSSIYDLIDEKAFDLVMYVSQILGSYVSNDVLQKVVLRIDKFKEKIKDLIKDQAVYMDELSARIKTCDEAINNLKNENSILRKNVDSLQRENLALKQDLA